MAPRWSPRAWFGTRVGRIALLGLTILSLVFCFVYLGTDGPFLAIPDLLFFGLAAPIYCGWKRPGHLALYGLAAILISAPITSALALEYVYIPAGAASSPTAIGASGPILDNAIVAPYSGATGLVYNFSVTVHPGNVPTGASQALWVELWVSTCPGATGPSDPYCSSGYPLIEQNQTLPAGLNSTANLSEASINLTFHVPINETNIWSWQMGTAYYAGPNQTNLAWVFLDSFAVQGPIVGDPSAIFVLAFESFTVSEFSGAGIVFFVGLLVYMWFKAREARRKALSAPPGAPPTPPATTGAVPAPVAGRPPLSAPTEKACPNCGAVVYPNESACWKCGATLSSGKAKDAPLPSQ
ncbi:MAG: hypothetical protein L3J73_04230 [Thermoplasmata archaeon]|nr:hypothetical protein [Thermoplasmata archaeon]